MASLALRVLAVATALATTAAPALAHPDIHQDLAAATAHMKGEKTAQDYLLLAELHRIAGELDGAEEHLQSAAALEPGLPAVALCRAALDLDRGRTREARESIAAYLALRPDDARAWILSARIAEREGRLLEGAGDLGGAVERLSSPRPDLILERSGLLRKAGHEDEALAVIDQGIARIGPVASLELGAVDALEARGDLAAALARLDRLAADLRAPGATLPRRAELLRRMGRDSEARWEDAAADAAMRERREGGSRGATVLAPPSDAVATATPAIIGSIARLVSPARTEATVTRGPYLAMLGSSRVTIRWRTDVATDSRVRYGASPGKLIAQVDDLALTTEHEITISGLAAGFTLYYSVGTSTAPLVGGDSQHRFTTAPTPGTTAATRIWVIGDSGTADANAAAVRDAFAAYSASKPANLWLMLGDNAYDAGTDAQYQAGVFDMYPALLQNTPLWPTRGNHDVLYSGAANDYYDFFTLPTAGEIGGLPSGTEAYYSFDYANIHFVCLDSEGSDRSVGGAMAVWLRADLAATPRDWVIAYWHHPPYSKGSHDSDNDLDSDGKMGDMRRNILPILDSAGVDLVLTGHSHAYERSMLIDGHYGVSTTLTSAMILDAGDGRWDGDGPYHKATLGTGPHEGAVYTVAGVGGQTGGGPLNHPVMVTSLNVLGSLVIDVQGPRLDARFLDFQRAVRDSFTIQKGAATGVGDRRAGPPGLRILGAQPERGAVRFAYRLERDAPARLVILDALGRHVCTVRDGLETAGPHEVTWDGADARGVGCGAGVYFAVLEVQGKAWARKVVRLGS